jgi:FkbM family methyltransferase
VSGATGHFYKGLNEFEFTSFLLDFLRPKDLFVDAGANIGAYSILASGVCGAKSIAVEPLPHAFAGLQEQIALNELEGKIQCHNIGLGEGENQLYFTNKWGQQNHVAVKDQGGVALPIISLDQLLKRQCPVLIKIDVEGYELPVLRGAQATLSNPALKAIIIEMMGLGQRYGYRDEQVDAMLRSHGFVPNQYFPKERSLQRLEGYRMGGNNLYLRGEFCNRDE